MLSLQDIFSESDVIQFIEKHSGAAFDVEDKIDGLSVSAAYQNGVLVKGETRGDGYIGEDITENIKFVSGFPYRLKPVPGGESISILEVRAEVYMEEADFNSLNAKRAASGKKLFTNSRNAADGLCWYINQEKLSQRF